MPKAWLTHPLNQGLSVDDPQTTLLRRRIIQEKTFLRLIYQEWYAAIAAALSQGPGPVLELGAGAGFLKECVPGLITSEIFWIPDIDLILNGQELPFRPEVLRGLVMVNVLHHIPQPRRFFAEATRCLRPGGVIVMIEPYITGWSRFVYQRLHQEPCWPEALTWEFPSDGPLSGANVALPWIIVARDRQQFEREFPQLQIRCINLSMPFRYLLSGGMSALSFSPGWTFGIWRRIEAALKPLMPSLAIFAQIEMVKTRPAD